jgi:ketosteroid isomerase-like protein
MRLVQIRLLLMTTILAVVGGCSITIGQQATPESEERAIRLAREAQNEAIRVHDLRAISEYWEAEVRSTAGTGEFVSGRDEYTNAFERAFAAYDDVVYTRVPDTIELSSVDISGVQEMASESGTWTGSWTSPRGRTQLLGVYDAMWRKRNGRWRIHSELFVALVCTGPECSF